MILRGLCGSNCRRLFTGMRLLNVLVYPLLGHLVWPVAADLTCLRWDPLVTAIGLICHFKPQLYTKLEEAFDAAVDSTRTAVKDLLHFDLTHHPAAVAYQYIADAEAGGLSQANQGLANVTHDFAQVGIGIGKDLANTGVLIYNLLDWSDITRCIVDGSVQNKTGPLPLVAHTVFPFLNDAARKMWEECAKAKFSKPLVYNITDPNQKIGASIAEIATLLVPVSDGTDAVKLALPGAEATTEIFKATSITSKTGELFENPVEGQLIADALQDEEYAIDHCFTCLSPADAAPLKRHLVRHRIQQRMHRTHKSYCCIPRVADISNAAKAVAAEEAVIGELSGTALADTEKEVGKPSTQTNANQDVGAGWSFQDLINARKKQEKEENKIIQDYMRRNYHLEGPTEDQLMKTAPDIPRRITSVASDIEAFKQEIRTQAVGQIVFSDALKAALKDPFSGKDFLPRLLDIFKQGENGGMYKMLKINGEEIGPLGASMDRLKTQYSNFANIHDERIEFIHEFVIQVRRQLEPFIRATYDYGESELKTNVEFFYSPPGDAEAGSLKYMKYHSDKSVLSCGFADQPGLVILNSHNGQAFRLPTTEDSFFAFPGGLLEEDKAIKATKHAVFGPEMSKNGRVSVVVQVKLSSRP